MRNEDLAIILAGGCGKRLEPLTLERSKPAVPFGGKYRIIDFTLTNCLHSGLRRIFVLTQYKSFSLHNHLRSAWSIFNPELGEFATAVPPQMGVGNYGYRGTADAVFQNINLLKRSGARRVLILSGDHVYRMDYANIVKYHLSSQADMTMATMVIDAKKAHNFGVLSVNNNNKIHSFQEKPLNPTTLPDDSAHALVSMGIYVFSIDLLVQTLEADAVNESSSHDFGKDIIPELVKKFSVYAFQFGTDGGRVKTDSYWRDVGTLDSYYEANMDLLKAVPPLNLYQVNWPIRSYHIQTPPLRAISGSNGEEGVFINSMAAGGVIIKGGKVHDSILFSQVFIDEGAVIRNVILFDDVNVGSEAKLKNCIVEKGIKIPAGESIGYDGAKDAERFTISKKGIVVIPRHYKFQ